MSDMMPLAEELTQVFARMSGLLLSEESVQTVSQYRGLGAVKVYGSAAQSFSTRTEAFLRLVDDARRAQQDGVDEATALIQLTPHGPE